MTATVSGARISDTFATARASGRLAFMPFLTAGDPDLQTTMNVIRDLARAGADLIEIGVPYSDPIADGPVIQASYQRALNSGFRLSALFEALTELHTESVQTGKPLPPLVCMVSYAIIYRTGLYEFVQRAANAGIAGLIVPDLPGDEAAEFSMIMQQSGLDLIELVSPLTPPERIKRILQNCRGFVYCIAVAGTTGERTELAASLDTQLERLRKMTHLPLAVGFGVSRPEHVAALKGKADGVIVGSAIVRQFESFGNTPAEVVRKGIADYATSMATACR